VTELFWGDVESLSRHFQSSERAGDGSETSREESGLLRITAALQWGAIGDYSNSNKSSPIEWHFGSLAINCRAINDATRGTFDRQIDASCHNYFPLSIHSDTLLLL
jgi:hypothetical protein